MACSLKSNHPLNFRAKNNIFNLKMNIFPFSRFLWFYRFRDFSLFTILHFAQFSFFFSRFRVFALFAISLLLQFLRFSCFDGFRDLRVFPLFVVARNIITFFSHFQTLWSEIIFANFFVYSFEICRAESSLPHFCTHSRQSLDSIDHKSFWWLLRGAAAKFL